MNSNTTAKSETLSPLQKAAIALRKAESRIKELEESKNEPITVLGMSCRFPGANSVNEYYELLRNGIDAVSETPPERWSIDDYYDPNPSAVGKINTRYGGFIDNVDKFDAKFFGLSALEARLMDPQQRLSLQLVWHALEDSGLRPSALRGSRTGVFVGVTQNDYGVQQLAGPDENIRAYSGTGNGFCFAAGRIAFQYGFIGPASAIDTACSSALVALHQASNSLRRNECDLAIVVGTQLNLTPPMQIFLSRTQSFSPSGRCRAFDANSDGFILGEGIGVLVLCRESDASMHGNLGRATLLNCAVNHDGPASGLTVPNQSSQEILIRDLLERTNVSPDSVSYIETHGTGTHIGDPIEIGALKTIFGNRADDNPLFIGSVKSNIGHLSAAAGVASVIKNILMLENEELFPQLHFNTPNPEIPWDGFNIKISKELSKLPRRGDEIITGVSSFGLSGTNAHILLQKIKKPNKDENNKYFKVKKPIFLTLSAKDFSAFKVLVDQHRKIISKKEISSDIHDYSTANNCSRDFLPIRRLFSGFNAEELLADLNTIDDLHDTNPARTQNSRGLTAFILDGSPHISLDLYRSEPSYKKGLDDCCKYYDIEVDSILLSSSLTKTDEAAVISAFSLMFMWRNWGISPDVIVTTKKYFSICNIVLDKGNINTHNNLIPKGTSEDYKIRKNRQDILELNNYIENQSIDWSTLQSDLKRLNVSTIISLLPGVSIPKNQTIFTQGYFENNEWTGISDSLKKIFNSGYEINWDSFSYNRNNLKKLPLYPFNERSYWIEDGENSNIPLKTTIEHNKNQSDNVNVKNYFESQWSELDKNTTRLVVEQLGEYQRLNRKDNTNSEDDILRCGKWNLKTFKGRDRREIEAFINRDFPKSTASDEDDIKNQKATEKIDLKDNYGTKIVWKENPDGFKDLDSQKEIKYKFVTLQNRASLVFVLAGVGDQYLNMGAGLYKNEPSFRSAFDECTQFLKKNKDIDLHQHLFNTGHEKDKERVPAKVDMRAMLGREDNNSNSSEASIDTTEISQPLIFSFVYSLAKMWMSFGLKPDYLIGYSVGEYVAACLSGVFSLEVGLNLVSNRAQLISNLLPGALLAIPLPENECRKKINEKVHVAITSGANQTIVGGALTDIMQLKDRLQAEKIMTRRLPGNHAYHTPLLKPVAEEIEKMIGSKNLQSPKIPVVSNVTGSLLKKHEAINPEYWAMHTYCTVRFFEGISLLLASGDCDILEVGPGRSLSSFFMQHKEFNKKNHHHCIPSLSGKWEKPCDEKLFLESLGLLSLLGQTQI